MKTNIKSIFYFLLVTAGCMACNGRTLPKGEGHDHAGPGTVNRDESVSRKDDGTGPSNPYNLREPVKEESDSAYQERISKKKHEQGNTTGDNGKMGNQNK